MPGALLLLLLPAMALLERGLGSGESLLSIGQEDSIYRPSTGAPSCPRPPVSLFARFAGRRTALADPTKVVRARAEALRYEGESWPRCGI